MSHTKMFKRPVCMDRLNNPRILTTCEHHFCRSCLEGITNLHPQGAVTCPCCRAVTPINPQSAVADLPRPVMFNALQERMLDHKPKNTREHPCDPCGKVAASYYCFQFREWLCSSCLKKHAKASIYEGHVTEDLPRVLFCQNHLSQAATLYCLDCSSMICARCCMEEHEGHKTEDVKKIAERRKKEIKKYLKKQTQKLEKHQRRIKKADKCIREMRENKTAKEKLLTEMLENVIMFQDELIKHKTKMDKINNLNIRNFEIFIAELNTNSHQIQQDIDLSNLDDLEQLSDQQFLVSTQGHSYKGLIKRKLPDSPRKVAMPVVNEIPSRALSKINELFQKLPGGSVHAAFIGIDYITNQGKESRLFVREMEQLELAKPRDHTHLPRKSPLRTLPASAGGKRKACQTTIKVRKKPAAMPQAGAQIVGNQPPGTMTSAVSQIRIDGYVDASDSIMIKYKLPSGKQGANDPNPGVSYNGLTRTAFLPNNQEGRQVLELLKRAFDAKVIFAIRKAITPDSDDYVTWNGIHHKTRLHGGPNNFGYPDPTYLSRVKNELAVKGIITPSRTDMATCGLRDGIN